jgi:hypothetical protein
MAKVFVEMCAGGLPSKGKAQLVGKIGSKEKQTKRKLELRALARQAGSVALSNLSRHGNAVQSLVKAGAVAALVQVCKEEDDEKIICRSCQALANLCAHQPTRLAISRQFSLLAMLTRLLKGVFPHSGAKFRDPQPIFCAAISALACLATEESVLPRIMNTQPVELLAQMCATPGYEAPVYHAVALCLQRLAVHRRFRHVLLQCGVHYQLVLLLGTGTVFSAAVAVTGTTMDDTATRPRPKSSRGQGPAKSRSSIAGTGQLLRGSDSDAEDDSADSDAESMRLQQGTRSRTVEELRRHHLNVQREQQHQVS